MHKLTIVSILLALFVPFAALQAEPPESPDRALCHVCRVHDGETELEPVQASAVFEDETYHFCSEGCRDKFLEDPVAYLPPVFPRPLPEFRVESFEGSVVASKDFEGRVTLLDFWATWCPPCVETMPRLDALHERLAGQGFQVVGISIDEGDEGAKKAQRFFEKRGFAYPVYHDATERPAWAALHVRAVPTMFLVDAEGRIVDQWSGHVEMDEVTRRVEQVVGSTEAR